MPDAARGVRQLVLLHGRSTAREMVEPEAELLVRIASEVLGDEKGRSGYSYSGLCLTSLPHRKLKDDQAWERTVGPLTLIIEPGRIKFGEGPSKLLGVPHGARARLILIYLQTQAVLTNSREVSLGRSMREWMGRMGLSVGGETASALREQARRIATCTMRFSWQTQGKPGDKASTMMTNERIIKSGLFFHDGSQGDSSPGDTLRRSRPSRQRLLRSAPAPSRATPRRRYPPAQGQLNSARYLRLACLPAPPSDHELRSNGAISTSSLAPDTATGGPGSRSSSRLSGRPSPPIRKPWSMSKTIASYCTPVRRL